jgi:hypothetical protein
MPPENDAPKTPAEEARESLRAMATPDFLREVSAQIRSRRPLMYLVTHEEKRVLEFFRHYAVAAGYRAFCWDCYAGLLNISDMQPSVLASADPTDVLAVLDWIIKEATEVHEASSVGQSDFKGNLYILWDFHRFLDPCTPDVERRLRTLARMNSRTAVIIVAPTLIVTPALEKDIAILDFPFPNAQEITKSLQNTVDLVVATDPACRGLREEVKSHQAEIVASVGGLTMAEVESAFAKSVVLHRRFDVPTIIKEKQQIIRKTGVLEYFTPELGIDDIGGLGNLMSWLKKRKRAFEPEARSYGLPMPRGVLIFGVPGSGKSLSAKATAKEYSMPLLRLDFGSLFSQFVGESERNGRQAIKIAEAAAPCVVYDTMIEVDNKRLSIGELFTQNALVAERYQDGDVIKFQKHRKITSTDAMGNKVQTNLLGLIRRRGIGKKLLKITTDDGRTIVATENHKFLVRSNNRLLWRNASQLKTEDDIVSSL